MCEDGSGWWGVGCREQSAKPPKEMMDYFFLPLFFPRPDFGGFFALLGVGGVLGEMMGKQRDKESSLKEKLDTSTVDAAFFFSTVRRQDPPNLTCLSSSHPARANQANFIQVALPKSLFRASGPALERC